MNYRNGFVVLELLPQAARHLKRKGVVDYFFGLYASKQVQGHERTDWYDRLKKCSFHHWLRRVFELSVLIVFSLCDRDQWLLKVCKVEFFMLQPGELHTSGPKSENTQLAH